MPEKKNPNQDDNQNKVGGVLDPTQIDPTQATAEDEEISKKDPEKFSRPTQKSEAPQDVLASTKTIMVDIRNRKEQFFRGEAKTVSSVNDTGEFDVLPKHANFVTLIRGYVVVDKGLTTEKKFEIDSGVLAAKTDSVDVYLDF